MCDSSSINDCKMQLRAYLKKLELEGWVSRTNDYQTIVTSIARDICNKSKYRVIRDKELQTLRATKERLDEKTKYYQEQVVFYNEYIKRCLQNLHGTRYDLIILRLEMLLGCAALLEHLVSYLILQVFRKKLYIF